MFRFENGMHAGDVQLQEEETDSNGRPIKPEEDLYPPPLITRCPSYTFYGNQRLFMALSYLRVDRVRQLINEYKTTDTVFHDQILSQVQDEQDRFDEITEILKDKYNNAVDLLGTNCYDMNVLQILCSGNTGANLCYSSNQTIYEQLLILFLKSMNPIPLAHLLNHQDLFGRTCIEEAVENEHYHLALALLHYGSPMVRDLNKIKYKPFQHLMQSPERLKTLLEEMKNPTQNCPISQSPIVNPAVLDDGSIYEASALLRWYKTRPIDMKKLLLYQKEAQSKDSHTQYLAHCRQWSGVYVPLSPITNLPLSGERAIYLPIGNNELDYFIHLDDL